MTLWSKIRGYLRHRLSVVRRCMWLVLPCICGAWGIGVFADVWYGWWIIGVLLLSFVLVLIYVGMETLDMKETDKKVLDVVAALIFDEAGRVLATQCAQHKHGGGWEFPGGKIEPGEAAEAAVVREITEELSLNVEVGQLLHTVNWHYPAFHLRMHCYVCTLLGGELTLREHVAVRWLTENELYSLEWLPADVDVLPWLARYMKENNH